MIRLPNGKRKYGDADGYDSYMGSWSAALSPPFIRFAGIFEAAHVLDIGCGTGNLLCSLATDFPRAKLVGIDPSTSLLEKARGRPELVRGHAPRGYCGTPPVPNWNLRLFAFAACSPRVSGSPACCSGNAPRHSTGRHTGCLPMGFQTNADH